MLVDEVLAVGDRGFSEKCYARIEEMLDGGRTLFFVSHNEKRPAAVLHARPLPRQGRAGARRTDRRGARALQHATTASEFLDGSASSTDDAVFAVVHRDRRCLGPDRGERRMRRLRCRMVRCRVPRIRSPSVAARPPIGCRGTSSGARRRLPHPEHRPTTRSAGSRSACSARRVRVAAPAIVRPGGAISASVSGHDLARDTIVVVRWFAPDGAEYLWQVSF